MGAAYSGSVAHTLHTQHAPTHLTQLKLIYCEGLYFSLPLTHTHTHCSPNSILCFLSPAECFLISPELRYITHVMAAAD